MKVGIKLVTLLLYLILATNAAPKGNGEAEGGENEGAEAIETGGERKAGEAGEQGEVGNVGEKVAVGEAREIGEIGKEQGLTKGVDVGKEGDNAVTVNLTTDFVKSQPPTAKMPTKEEPEATSFVTEAATDKQRSEVAPFTPETSTMPLVTRDDFSYLDQNGDGFLDYRELFIGQNSVSTEYLDAAFQISDKNFDGVVDTREFFRHPLSWGRVVAEKQFFAKDISTSGPDTSETLTSQPDVTPTAEQTYNASPDSTSPSLPEDNVTTTVPSAEQNTTVLTAVDQQPSGPTDTSTRAHVSVVDQVNGTVDQQPSGPTDTSTRAHVSDVDQANGTVDQQPSGPTDTSTRAHVSVVDQANGTVDQQPSGPTDTSTRAHVSDVDQANGTVDQQPSGPTDTSTRAHISVVDQANGTVDQQPSGPTDTSTRAHVSVVDQADGGRSVALPKVTQGKKEVANGKAGSQVGSESEARTGSMIGNRTGDMVRDGRLGTEVVSNGNQTTARKEKAVAGSTGGQAGMASGQKDEKRTGAESSGGQPSGVPRSVSGHGQRGGYDQNNGQTEFAGSAGRHAVTVTGKAGGHAKSHGVQHRTTAVTHTTGVQSGASIHPGEQIHGRTVANRHPQIAPVKWPVKAPGNAGPQYHRWNDQKWVKADVEKEVARSSFYGKSKVSEYNGIAKSAGMEKKYLLDLNKEGTKAAAQSEEDPDEKSSNEAEDKKDKDKNGKGNGDNESDDTDDNDEKDRK